MCLGLLRGKLVFIIGFFTGFTCTIFIALLNSTIQESKCLNVNCHHGIFLGKLQKNMDNIVVNSKEESTISPTMFSYENWLKIHNLSISNVDMDRHQYKPTSSGQLIESDWLKERVNVICVVTVNKIALARSIKATWASRCNKIYFFSKDIEDVEIPIVKHAMKITCSWQMLCESMHQVWNSSNKQLEWVIFVQDDTLVIPENARHLVAALNHNDDYYLGHAIILLGVKFNTGQAGYILSRGAFQKIIRKFDTHEKCSSSGKYWKKEDYYLGKHLQQLGISPSDTRDRDLRGTFHGYTLSTMLWGVAKSGSFFRRAVYPSGPHCCSSRSVTFSVYESDMLHTLNYILYRLHVYKHPGRYGTAPAPTSVPENEIWKLALKEEFNLTDVDHISNDYYYKIWRLRYSEPSQFIFKSRRNMSEVFESIWTAQEDKKKFLLPSTT